MLKKSFSQNLIKDGNTLRKMVALAEIAKDDMVIEIGAGQGDLTRAIARSARKVIAVELDRDMIPYLDSLASGTANVEIRISRYIGRRYCRSCRTTKNKSNGKYTLRYYRPYYI